MVPEYQPKNSFIFIYGSLLSQLKHPAYEPLDKYAKKVGWGSVQGKLFDLGRYPGLILSDDSSDRVHGEVYRITDPERLFIRLDRYEGCSDSFPEPHLFVRQQVPVQVNADSEILAWTYLYNFDPQGHKQIQSGSYLEYL